MFEKARKEKLLFFLIVKKRIVIGALEKHLCMRPLQRKLYFSFFKQRKREEKKIEYKYK